MRFTLVSDGSSDRALMPILLWALREAGILTDLEPQWADLRTLKNPPFTLVERIEKAIEFFPCEILFVHRDSEDQRREVRITEIDQAIQEVQRKGIQVPYISVVPVRMQEAWLLFDERAIRTAAGNPNGRSKIALPELHGVEDLPDPKQELFEAIRIASELPGRRLRKLSLGKARLRVSELIDDFSPLRQVSAFQDFERDLRQIVERQHWQ